MEVGAYARKLQENPPTLTQSLRVYGCKVFHKRHTNEDIKPDFSQVAKVEFKNQYQWSQMCEHFAREFNYLDERLNDAL